MKTAIVLAALLGLACGQGGFFSNLFGGSSRRPPPPQQQQQQQFNRPPPNQSFRPQPQFNQPPPQQQQQQFNPPQQQFNQPPQQQQFRQPPQQLPQSVDIGSGAVSTSSCPLRTPNFNFQGRGYIVTFFDSSDGCNKFTGEEADAFCQSVGGRAVSLDSNEKALAMMDLLRQRAQRYMWTGGRIDHNAGVVTWPSGAREGYVRGQRFWSTTGGKEPVPEPQPDNRDGNEVCIGVLNNFYADGIKWHDVACHHRKPTICEL